MTISTLSPPQRLAWGIWSLAAVLYVMGFYQRVAPAVMTQELVRDFGLSGAALGNLSALYFYSYAAMQIPTGILVDRYGPRRLLSAAALLAGAGTFMFSAVDDYALASLARLIIGGAVAVAFVGLLKLAAHWFAPRQYALAAGMALFLGVIGAILAGVPLRLGIDLFGWRAVMAVSGGLTVLVGIAIWLWVRDDPGELGYRSYAPMADPAVQRPKRGILSGLAEILRQRNPWLLFVVPGSIAGAITTFAGLWGVPYLVTLYGLEQKSAAALCSLMLVAWAFGGPVFGMLSDRSRRRRRPYLIGCGVVSLGWGLLVLSPGLPLSILIVDLVLIGFFSGAMVIGFAYIKESVPPDLAGTATGFCNAGVMLGATILQPVVGVILDANWSGQLNDGVRIYDAAAYQAAFLVMLLWVAMATVLMALTRETHCRPAVGEAAAGRS